MTKLLKSPIDGGFIQADMNIVEQNVSIYSVLNGTPIAGSSVTCANNAPVFCDISVSKSSTYSNVSRVIMKLSKLSGTVGDNFAVYPADDNYAINTNCAIGSLSEVVEDGISYCVVDLSAYFFDCMQSDFKVAIYTTTSEIVLDTTTPMLEVEFTADNDFIPNVGKIEKNLGTKGAYTLNTRNGKMFYTQRLYQSKGGKLPFDLSITYNPCDATNSEPNNSSSAMKGWTFSYDQTLAFSETDCTYLDGQHRYHTFNASTNNSSIKHDTSLRNGNTLFDYAGGHRISDGKGTYLDFTSNKLSTITVTPGETTFTTTITRNDANQIIMIQDGLGDVYNFEYTTATIIVKKEETDLVTISLTNQQVTDVYYHLDGRNITFTYNDDGLITSAQDSLAQEKIVWEYTPNKEVCAVKHYIVGANEVPTESYHLSYDFLETRVDMCRYSDNQSSKFCSMMYVYATDGQMTHSYELQNEPKNARINNRGDYSRAIYSAQGDAIVNVTSDGANGTGFLFDARNADCCITSDSFTLNTATAGTNLFMLYSQAEIDCRTYCLDPAEQFISMSVQKDGTTIASVPFNISKKKTQIQGCAFVLPDGTHELTVEFRTSGIWGQVTFTNMRVFAMETGFSKQCINVNTQTNSITEYVDNTAVTAWYDSTRFNLTYDAETITNVRYTAKDHILTTLSRIQNPSCFNLWYNDGENMLGEITGASLTCGTGMYGIGSVQCASISNSNGKTIIQYVETDSTYLYKECTTTMVGTNSVRNIKYVNDNFQTAKVVDEHGITTEYTYDTNGSVTKVVTTAPTGTLLNIVENSTYNDYNLLATSKHRRYLVDYTQSYTYGDDYELTEETQPNSQATSFAYSADKDKLTSISATLDSSTSQNNISYDGDLVDTLSDTRTLVDFAYDDRHNISQVTIAGTTVLSKEITYNEYGTTQSVTTYGNGQKVKKYYDKYDRLIKVSDVTATESVLVQYIYNDDEIDQSTFDVATFTPIVSANSPLRVVVDNVAGTTTWYNYDEFGRFIECYNDNLCIAQAYDEYGRIYGRGRNIDIGTSIGTNIYTYASAVDDTIVSETTMCNAGTLTSTYTRDGLQRPTETTVMHGDYGYKQAFEYIPRQESERVSIGQVTVGGLPSFAIVTTEVGTTNYVSKFKEYSMSGDTATLVRTDAIEYDANGNITKYGDVTYEYDNLNRLVRENNLPLDKTTTWCYDINGNITYVREYAYTTDASPTDGTTTAFIYGTSWKDQLSVISVGTTAKSISYDQSGNPTTYKGATLSWTRGRLLASYTPSGSTVERTLKYDANGIRCQKNTRAFDQDNITVYIYDGNNLISEYKVDEPSSRKTFLYNSQGLVGFVYQDVTYTYRKNLFGDIVAIYNGSTKVAEYVYDAWGNQTVMDGDSNETNDLTHIANVNPFRYRGYYWDNDIQLYYLMSRYYDPQTGRFINADTLDYLDPETIGGLNLYAYCGNNPVMGIDPEGHMPQWLETTLKITAGVAIIAGCIVGSIFTAGTLSVVLAGAAIGAIAGGASAGLSTAVAGGDIHDFANAFLTSTISGAISGAVAASPLNMWAQAGVNAGLSALTYLATQSMNGDPVTLGGLVFSAATGFACGLVGKNGWTHGGVPSYIANAGKNAFKNIFGIVGAESVLRLAVPPFIFAGAVGGLYGKINSIFNPNGNFIGL